MSPVKRSILLQILSKSFVSHDMTFVRMCVGVKETKPIALQEKFVQNVSCECCLPCQKEKEKVYCTGQETPKIKKTGMFVKNFVNDVSEILRFCFLGAA